jgi:hypothetical protein
MYAWWNGFNTCSETVEMCFQTRKSGRDTSDDDVRKRVCDNVVHISAAMHFIYLSSYLTRRSIKLLHWDIVRVAVHYFIGVSDREALRLRILVRVIPIGAFLDRIRAFYVLCGVRARQRQLIRNTYV